MAGHKCSRVARSALFGLVLLAASCADSGDGPVDAASTVPATTLQVPETTAAPPSSTQTSSSTTTSTTTTPPPPPRIVYIAVDGSDANDGTSPDTPVASVPTAATLVATGGTIVLLPGNYPPIELIDIHGVDGEPLRIRASPGTFIEDADLRTGAAIAITGSSHLELSGFSVRRALWGVYVSASNHIDLLANDVANIGQEAIRIVDGSNNLLLAGNRIADTGQRTDIDNPNGEGIYIGTGTPAGVDLVHDVLIRNNVIERTTDEAIDVKRPAQRIEIIGNEIYDVVTRTSGAIVVHLNADSSDDPEIRIEQNIVRNVTRSSPYRDGNCIVVQATVTIVNNVLHGCQHRGVYVRGAQGVARIEHNTLIDTGSFGAVVSDGLGQEIISRNNLGVDGTTNRLIDASDFVDLGNGDYRILPDRLLAYSDAPAIGIVTDLVGRDRPETGSVTFGALEGSPS